MCLLWGMSHTPVCYSDEHQVHELHVRTYSKHLTSHYCTFVTSKLPFPYGIYTAIWFSVFLRVNINIILLLYLYDKSLKTNNKYVQPHIIILKPKRFGHSCDHNQGVLFTRHPDNGHKSDRNVLVLE